MDDGNLIDLVISNQHKFLRKLRILLKLILEESIQITSNKVAIAIYFSRHEVSLLQTYQI